MSDSVSNIDIFYASAALIFTELYKNVPVPITLNYAYLSSIIFQDESTSTREKITEVFINTVTWLKKSGYIWLDSESEQDVYGALLSPKGLEVLSITPDSQHTAETIGEKLVALEKGNSQEDRAALVKFAISEGTKTL